MQVNIVKYLLDRFSDLNEKEKLIIVHLEEQESLVDKKTLDIIANHQLRQYCKLKLLFLQGRFDETEPLIGNILQDKENPLVYPTRYLQVLILWREGMYQNVISLCEDQLENKEFSSRFKFVIGAALHDLGRFDESIAILQEIRGFDDQVLLGKINTSIADALTHLGNYNEAKLLLDQSEGIFLDLDNQFQFSLTLHIKAIYHFFLTEYDQAIDSCKKALEIMENYGHKQQISRIIYTLGEIYYSLGEFQLASSFLNRALVGLEGYKNNRDKSYPHMILGLILNLTGEYDLAINELNEAVKFAKLVGNEQDLSSCYQILGEIYYSMNKLREAVKFLRESLILKRNIGNDTLTVITLFQLIITHHQMGSGKNKKYFEELYNLNQNSSDAFADTVYRIALAFDLKQRGRIRDKVQAISIFEQILETKIDAPLRIFVIMNVCEILLDELKMTQNQDIVTEIMGYLDLVQSIAEHNQSYSLLLDLYFLRTRLYLLIGDVKQVSSIFTFLDE